jgi:hypothetical protein
MLADLRKPSPPWGYILLGWLFYGLYMSVESYVIRERLGSPITWQDAFAGDFSYSLVWIPLTPLILWLARLFPFDKGRIIRNISIHLIFSLAFGLAHKALQNVVLASYKATFHGAPFSWDLQYRNIIAYFDYGIQLYWIILLLKFGYDYYARFREQEVVSSRLETQLATAQLQSLKMQIQPHFLFNTLNAISVLIEENPASAKKMVGLLSGLLRRSLDHVNTHVVPLEREMEFIDAYLEIQKARFGERLTVITNISPETSRAEVPYLVLQPLVENAIQHGISARPGPGEIRIESIRLDGFLKLVVTDSGSGAPFAAPPQSGSGIGLSNTRARLEQLYGEQQQLELSLLPGGGTEVTVLIPYKVQ